MDDTNIIASLRRSGKQRTRNHSTRTASNSANPNLAIASTSANDIKRR